MPKEEPNYFGVNLGQAIATGAGHISEALQRKYAMQRREEEMARQREEEKAAQNQSTRLSFAKQGIDYDSENPAAGWEAYIAKSAGDISAEDRLREAQIKRTEFQSTPEGQHGGMVSENGYNFLTGPGGIQYVPTKYGPRFVPPEPIAINPNTGEQISMPRGGKIVEPTGSKDAKTVISKVKGFTSAIDELESVLTKVPSGRIAGGSAKLANKTIGAFPEVRTAESLGGLMVPMATRIIGGDVGNLSETEQVAARKALELSSGTIEERRQAISLLRMLLENKRQEAEKIIQGSGTMWDNTQPQMGAPDALPAESPLSPEEKAELEQLRAKRAR